MAEATPKSDSNTFFAIRSEMAIAMGALAVFMVLLIPMPSQVLDMFLALNLAMSVMLLLVTLNAKEPLEVSVFPSLLLLLTLYRLALNVATTRLILSNGDGGRIVDTFGGMIVGNSLVVGIVIFLILVIIQFIVITKGATRISEVNARFVLDAMPGKQMAIDAELTAQAITQEEAKARRDHLTSEAEFYGAMDGASKYVRGDAVAGLIITAINLFGGVVIGMMAGRSISEALSTYSQLTVGDGLISQIPALIIATTSGILVTKASSDKSLGEEVGGQMLSSKRPLIIGAVILVVIGLIPGLPKLPFFGLAIGMFLLSRRMDDPEDEKSTTGPDGGPQEKQPAPTPDERTLHDFVSQDRILIEVGLGLAGSVESGKTIGLGERTANLRTELANSDGFWVPTIRIRTNPDLGTDKYTVAINNRVVGSGELRMEEFLAINSGAATLDIDGDDTIEPAFGLDAKWITATTKRRAEMGGYTVVDAHTVLVTHLSELFRTHAHELLGLEDLQKMLKQVEVHSPTVVNELKPDVIRMGTLRRVLANLLEEKVSIAGLENILESIAHHGQQVKIPELLSDLVRQDVGYVVCQRFLNEDGMLQVIMLDPQVESRFREQLHEGKFTLEGKPFDKLIQILRETWEKYAVMEKHVALVTNFQLRRPLREAIFRSLPDLSVIAFTEIPKDMPLAPPAALIRSEQLFEPAQLMPAQFGGMKPNQVSPLQNGGGFASTNTSPMNSPAQNPNNANPLRNVS